MAITKLQPNAIPTNTDFTITLADGSVVTNDIADANVTHAKLHTDMDLSGKTVTLPALNNGVSIRQADLSKGTYITPIGTLEMWRDDGIAYIDFKSSSDEDYDTRIQAFNDGLKFIVGGNTGTKSKVVIDSSSNVGIGVSTDTPSGRLHVNNTGTLSVFEHDTGWSDIKVAGGNGGSTPTNHLLIRNYGNVSSATIFDNVGGGGFRFSQDNVAAMTVDADGRLLLGQTGVQAANATMEVTAWNNQSSCEVNFYGDDTDRANGVNLQLSSGSGSAVVWSRQQPLTVSTRYDHYLQLGAYNENKLRLPGTGYFETIPQTGANILGTWKYAQSNAGLNVQHYIRGPQGNYLQSDVGGNKSCYITICTTGTGTNNMYCIYHYTNNSDNNAAVLTHVRGNSGASSNRPYMQLNGQDPVWLMSHSGGYQVDIKVELVGGSNGYTWRSFYNYNAT